MFCFAGDSARSTGPTIASSATTTASTQRLKQRESDIIHSKSPASTLPSAEDAIKLRANLGHRLQTLLPQPVGIAMAEQKCQPAHLRRVSGQVMACRSIE